MLDRTQRSTTTVHPAPRPAVRPSGGPTEQVTRPRPVRVRLSGDVDVVQVGVSAILRRYPERVALVERTGERADVVLFDPMAAFRGGFKELADLARGEARAVAFSWSQDRLFVDCALRVGAAGYLHKGLTGPVLAASIVRIARGEQIVRLREAGTPVPARSQGGDGFDDRDDAGLSGRELEVLVLIGEGFSNYAIASLMYVSPNTVKTYIRTAYRKIGATTRSHAVKWAVQRQQAVLPRPAGDDAELLAAI